MYTKKYLPWVVAVGFVASLGFVVALPVFAQGMPNGGGHFGMRGGGMAPGVFGTVSAINGTTLTVTSKAMMRPNTASAPAATVYTIDAGSAKVMKNGTSSTVADIATGDLVMVQGTVSGTNVTATVIRDGVGGMMGRPGMGGFMGKGFGHGTTSTPPFQGNGQPIVGGKVAAISGETLTVTSI